MRRRKPLKKKENPTVHTPKICLRKEKETNSKRKCTKICVFKEIQLVSEKKEKRTKEEEGNP